MKKFVADALSCLDMSENQVILSISELYGYDDDDLPDSAYPIYYHGISKTQKTDAKLQQKTVSHKDYTLNTLCGLSVGTKCAEVVLVDDFVRDTGQHKFHVLVAGHGGTVVKILDV